MKSCKIYLVRHGESVANYEHIVCGQFDSPLTDRGIKQSYETKQLLDGIHFDAAYSSDLQRTSKTAEIIFGQSIPKSHLLPALRERSFGKLEGTSANVVWHRLSKAYDKKFGSLPLEERWKHSYADYIESNGALSRRFLKALQQISKKHLGETVLVGTHGGNIRTTLVKLGYAKEFELPPGSFKNSGYAELSCDGKNFKIEQVVGVDKSK